MAVGAVDLSGACVDEGQRLMRVRCCQGQGFGLFQGLMQGSPRQQPLGSLHFLTPSYWLRNGVDPGLPVDVYVAALCAVFDGATLVCDRRSLLK